MASTWRAVFADLLTDRTIDVLPMTGVSSGVTISQGGTLSGTIPVPDEAMGRRVAPIIEGRTAVYLYQEAVGTQIWAGGIVWTRSEKREPRGGYAVDIQAGTFDTYLNHRRIRSTLAYVQEDQLAIARSLWEHAQAHPAGDVGVRTGAEMCHVARDARWNAGEEATYADAIEEIAQTHDGFEWLVDVYLDSAGNRVRELRLGCPHVGDPDTVTRITRDHLLGYELTGDATRAGTAFRARGSTPETDASDSVPLYSDVYTSDGWLDAGWPLLDVTEDHPDVQLVGTLNQKARRARNTRSGTVRLASLRVDPRCGLRPAHLGTSVRAVITDPLHPRNQDGSPSLDVTRRIVGIQSRSAERGQGDELVLVFEEIEDEDA